MKGDTVSEIKERLSIKDVVEPYVKLRKAGRSLVGLCPFHKEKTGSFHVSIDRGTYHCFGCGEGGDAFSFIQKVEGVDFKGALKMLAEKAGIEIRHDPAARERSSRTERLREVMARAAQWYAAQLGDSTDAYAYACKRGLTPETIKSWGLGLAPDTWRALLEALTTDSFKTEELLAAGLIKEADGKKGTYYDRFRNRLIFPIRDSAGRVVAFTGRALSVDDAAKYLNSPETDLYHKSEILFGLDRAKDAIRTRGFTMLVEGQMDALHAHQAGWSNAVALSGTALTTRHLSLMKRFSENLMLVLDADAAGLVATAKSAALALREGLRVKAVRLPEGKDPADLISEDPKAFAARVKDAKPAVEFFLAELSAREKDPHRLLRAAERVVLPLLAAIPSPMEREYFMQSTARTLGLSPETIQESLKRVPKEGTRTSTENTATVKTREKRTARVEREIMLRATIAAYPKTPLAKRVASEYARITEATLPSDALSESDIFHAEEMFGEEPSEDAADELLRAFEEAVIREAYQEAVQELRRAEAAGDAVLVERAGAKCAKLSAQLSALRK